MKKEIKLKVVKMTLLRWICSVTRLDTIKNEYVRGSLGLMNIARKMKEIKLKCFECVKIHIQYIEIGGEGID